jgi:hypothetical protein
LFVQDFHGQAKKYLKRHAQFNTNGVRQKVFHFGHEILRAPSLDESRKMAVRRPALVGLFAPCTSGRIWCGERWVGQRELKTSSSETINGLALSRDGCVLAVGTIQRPSYKSGVNIVHLWDARLAAASAVYTLSIINEWPEPRQFDL